MYDTHSSKTYERRIIMHMRATAIPTALLETGRGVIRPQDARDVYVNPGAELKRLAERGALLRLARGYYAIVPEQYRSSSWRPPLEAAALGVGIADYGIAGAILMGLSAARIHGAVPRAIGRAWVGVEAKRPDRHLSIGSVDFVYRDVDRLDALLVQAELGPGLITSPTQTALDLADHPGDWGGGTTAASDAIRSLLAQVDWDLVRRLAGDRRRRPAYTRLLWLGSTAMSRPGAPLGRGQVRSLGLRHPEGLDPGDFGIEP